MHPEQPAVPAVFTAGSLDVDGRSMTYLEAGNGEPLIVLHGVPGLAANLHAVHAELAKTYHVIAPELPGFGAASGAGIESVRDLGALIGRFAAVLGLQSYAVLGTTIGGYAGLWLAIDHPEAVTRLVLEAPSAFRPNAQPPGPPPGTDPETLARVAYVQKILGPSTPLDLIEMMPTCEVSTLVLLAEKDHMFSPVFAADYRRLPASTVAIVYGAGRTISRDRPDAFLATVTDYLARGQAFVVQNKSTLIHA